MTPPEHSEADATSATAVDSRSLPGTFRVEVSGGTEQHLGPNGEPVLLGGDPLRLLRLSPTSSAVLEALRSGRTLSEAATSCRVSLRSVSSLVRRLLDRGIVHPLFLDAERRATSDNDVTIVVPVKDRAAQLDRLLTSIRHSPDTATCEVIVVDDGSHADERDQIATLVRRHRATLIRHEQSLGPAGARNVGAGATTTGSIAFVDSDCEVTPGWLSRCLAHFDDPCVAVVAPRIVAMPSASDHPLHAYESVHSSLDLGSQPARVAPMHRVAYVPAAALVVRRRAFEELGGFNEDLHVGEDVDFVWRANICAHMVRFEPGAHVAHDHRTSWWAFSQRRFQYATSTALLDRLHPGQVPPIVISPWSVGAWAGIGSQTMIGLGGAVGIVGYSAAKFPAKLGLLREPGPVAARLVVRGHLGAGRQLASATWRAYLPLTVVAGLISRRARRWALATAVIANVLDFRDRKPRMNPLTYVAIRLLDDTSYCAGLWWGCMTTRNLRPLKPKVVNWPGRRSVTEDS